MIDQPELLDCDCPECDEPNKMPAASFDLLGQEFTCPACGAVLEWQWETSIDGESSFFFLERRR